MPSQKLFRFEVDQSIRIEEMNKDSIVALANTEKSFTLKIPRRAKRQAREFFRRQGQPKQFPPSIFAAAIILAVRKSNYQFHDLVIDIEYPGYEKAIITLLNHALPDIKIYFTSIGKKSPAHYAAYGVYIKKRRADMLATADQLLRMLHKTK